MEEKEQLEAEDEELIIIKEDIVEAVQHLETNKTPGIDHINAELL